MAGWLPMRAASKKKLAERLSEVFSNFDDFTFELKWLVRNLDKYAEIQSKFPYADVGFRQYKGMKKAIIVDISKSMRTVNKCLARDETDESIYRNAMLMLNRKIEIRWHWLDTYITIWEWN